MNSKVITFSPYLIIYPGDDADQEPWRRLRYEAEAQMSARIKKVKTLYNLFNLKWLKN